MRERRNAQNLRWNERKVSRSLLIATVVVSLFVPVARAQQQEEQKGLDQGNYNIKQSIEFGGRLTSISGNEDVYDTFVNLQQGARLLGFTTEMRSLDHHATVFDRLYFSNFGYGGDPNEVSRLRISKNKVYGFDALFRKDQNFWNYSLLANPLNPTTPFANGPAGYGPPACTSCVVGFSPHLFSTRRKLGDYSLLLLPQSKIRFRAAYSRNTVEGPGFSSIHEGTDQALFEEYKTTVNAYRIGVDYKVLPRTNISYDQIWNYYKGDTGATDPFLNPLFRLSNGAVVDPGLPLNAGANQPCAGTFLATGFLNPTCSSAFSYLNARRTRTSTPTEQLSMQSNYWRSWELSAHFSYSGGDTNVANYNESFFGRVSRTNVRNDLFTGPVDGRRVAGAADFGATWHISDKLNFIDSFHFLNWHNPVQFLSSECAFFSGNLLTPANVFSTTAALPLTCTPPPDGNTAAGAIPVHSTSSGPDISILNLSRFLKQDEKTNLSELEYQFSPRLGARVGFRYRSRTIADGKFTSGTFVFFPNLQNSRTPPAPYNTDQNGAAVNCPVANNVGVNGPCFLTLAGQGDTAETPIHEYGGLFGIWVRPANNWQVRFDLELMSADNAFTRISPRQSQEYRVRTKYKVANWLNVNGSVMIWEGRNNVFETNHLQHNRAYGLAAIIQPTEKFGMEIGYDYNDVFSSILICYVSVANGQPGPGIQPCPDVPGLVQQLSTYKNNSHYGYFDFTFTPVRRISARLGANLTGTSGSQLRLDPQALIPNQVTGSLNSLWLHPFGGVDCEFARHWTAKAYWDYYGYHEDPTAGAVVDLFVPRNFRGNLVTLSMRYAF
ncbi:MAG TPA: hypothetical protein VN943_06170 [Candidatus Acidoferrum sp.]|nr:hypothetical protein [Candidatus Acidoferrum sp.]